jgi:hypothetical protein
LPRSCDEGEVALPRSCGEDEVALPRSCDEGPTAQQWGRAQQTVLRRCLPYRPPHPPRQTGLEVIEGAQDHASELYQSIPAGGAGGNAGGLRHLSYR